MVMGSKSSINGAGFILFLEMWTHWVVEVTHSLRIERSQSYINQDQLNTEVIVREVCNKTMQMSEEVVNK